MATHTTRGRHEEAYVRQAPPLQRVSRRKRAAKSRVTAEPQRELNRMENLVENTGRRLEGRLSRIPYIAAVGAGIGLFALAEATGVGEVALAGAGAYAVLRLLKQRRSTQRV